MFRQWIRAANNSAPPHSCASLKSEQDIHPTSPLYRLYAPRWNKTVFLTSVVGQVGLLLSV